MRRVLIRAICVRRMKARRKLHESGALVPNRVRSQCGAHLVARMMRLLRANFARMRRCRLSPGVRSSSLRRRHRQRRAAASRTRCHRNIRNRRATTRRYFSTPRERRFINAACARIIPKDDLGPGALEAGVPDFIDRQLAGPFGQASTWYMQGPWTRGQRAAGLSAEIHAGAAVSPCDPQHRRLLQQAIQESVRRARRRMSRTKFSPGWKKARSICPTFRRKRFSACCCRT